MQIWVPPSYSSSLSHKYSIGQSRSGAPICFPQFHIQCTAKQNKIKDQIQQIEDKTQPRKTKPYTNESKLASLALPSFLMIKITKKMITGAYTFHLRLYAACYQTKPFPIVWNQVYLEDLKPDITRIIYKLCCIETNKPPGACCVMNIRKYRRRHNMKQIQLSSRKEKRISLQRKT